MRKVRKNKLQEQTDLKKADDITRRRFIQRMGLFLGAFSVPWAIRMETMSKFSRRILGGSLAFAQQGSVGRIHIMIQQRSGFPLHNMFCHDLDFTNVIATRGFFESPNVAGTDYLVNPVVAGEVQRIMTAGGNYLYFPSVMETFAAAYADRIVAIDGVLNQSGHTNMMQTSTTDQSAHRLVTSAWKNATGTSPAIMSGPLGYAEENRAHFGQSGPLGAAYSTTYVRSVADVISSFDEFKLTPADGSPLSQSATQEILAAIQANDAQVLEKLAIETRPGGPEVVASLENVHKLLTENLADLVDPAKDAGLVGRISNGVNDATLSSVDTMSTIFAQIIRMAENNVQTAFGIQNTTGDWHGRGVLQGSNNGAARDDAIAWNALLKNVCDELATKPDPSGVYANLLERTTIDFTSEFTRNNGNVPADFSDGVQTGTICITDPSIAKGGMYGGHQSNLSRKPPTLVGNASPNSVAPNVLANTLLSLAGISDEEKSTAGFPSGLDKVDCLV